MAKGQRKAKSCKMRWQASTQRVVIPELEQHVTMRGGVWNAWTAEEDAVLRAYYGRVPCDKIAEYLNKTFPHVRPRTRLAVISRVRLLRRRGLWEQPASRARGGDT